MDGYRLSRSAAASERTWSQQRGNVVQLNAQRGVAEKRMLVPADAFGANWQELLTGGLSSAGIPVTMDTALRVPAFSAAVNVIANTIASLPLDVYQRKAGGGREEASGLLPTLLHDAPNEYQSSYEFWRCLLVAKLTGGRGLAWIERRDTGAVAGLWPMDPARTTVRMDGFRRWYEYNDPKRGLQAYNASEVIDLPFMLMADSVTARGPLGLGRDAIALALAVNDWSSKFFNGGGVPPFMVKGNFQTPGAAQRAADDFAAAIKKAASEQRMALTVPAEVDVKQLGANPEQSQTVELQRFCIEQIARLFGIPPTFLQDLTHGTFSNTEQQDLHFVKHTVLHHVRQIEQELNLKLFGQTRRGRFVEFNIDGLLRGDFTTRMEGWRAAINSALVTPAEARRSENWPEIEGSDRLFIQSATVPLDQAGQPVPGNGGNI